MGMLFLWGREETTKLSNFNFQKLRIHLNDFNNNVPITGSYEPWVMLFVEFLPFPVFFFGGFELSISFWTLSVKSPTHTPIDSFRGSSENHITVNTLKSKIKSILRSFRLCPLLPTSSTLSPPSPESLCKKWHMRLGGAKKCTH